MRRVVLAIAALLFWLPAFAEAAPSVRHAVAAKVCRAGSVRLGDGLCCPRSGVTRGGGCVSGAIRPGIVPPPLAYCPGGRTRDALGRCPAKACMMGYIRDRFGRCEREHASCANGRTPNALGQCPPVIATPQVGVNKTCLGGQPALAGGVCPPLFLCSNGYAPVAGRCSPGASLPLTRPHISAPASLARPAIEPLASPRLAAPQIHTAPPLARPPFAAPRLQPSPALAQPHFARPMAPQLAAPHLAPVPLIHPMAPPALAAPHFAPSAPAPHFAPAAPAAAPHLL